MKLEANIEAERTVLGAVLIDPEALHVAAVILGPEDFSRRAHRHLFTAMLELAERDERIDTVTLADELTRLRYMKEVGGPSYIAGLLDGLPRVSNVEEWAHLVRRDGMRRSLAELAAKMNADANDASLEPVDVADSVMQRLLELSGKGAPQGFLDNKKLAQEAMREIARQADSPDGVLGLHTGLVDVDRKLQGLRPGTMGIIAARAKKGKSVLSMQIAEHVAETEPGVVAVFSLEMSGPQLTKRRLSSIALVNVNRLHEADEEQRKARWGRIGKAVDVIVDRRLRICTSAYTVPQIHAACRRLRVETPLSLVVVDYAQLLESTRKHDKGYQEIREISRALTRLALELEVPVVVAAQLNRLAEGKHDKRPSSAEIADGDSLIRDCSWCILIHRDLQPRKGQDPNELKNVAHLILSDNRNGWNGTIRVRWNPALARFEDLAKQEQTAAQQAEERGAA